MQAAEFQRYRELKDVGWAVDKRPAVRPHSGHETLTHFLCKSMAVWLAVEQNLRVSTEVPWHDAQTADVLVHGNEEIAPFVIEFDTDCSGNVVRANVETYGHGPVVAEVFTIDVGELDPNPEEIVETLQEETWL